MAKKTTSGIISAILYIIVGVLLIAFPGNAIGLAMTVAGVLFIISGILEAVKKNWGGGAVSIVIGIAILLLGNLLVDIVLLVLGILLAIKGIVDLIGAIVKKSKTTVLDIVFPILTTVLGVLLAFGGVHHIIVIVAGALLVLDGVVGIISAIKKN
jgi:uncharacterized membrane protein HdeD (DUF308 family)